MSDHAEHHDHVVPVPVYLGVFMALLVGTAITVGAAFVDLGAWNTPVAMAIAITKAMLVILYFMHVKYGNKLVPLAIAGAVYWLAHLLVGTVADYATRNILGNIGS